MKAPKHVTGPRRPLFHTERAAMERRVPVSPNTPAGVQAVPSWGMDFLRARYYLVVKTNPDGTKQYVLEPQ